MKDIYEGYEVIGECEINARENCDSYLKRKCKQCKHFIPIKTDFFEKLKGEK